MFLITMLKSFSIIELNPNYKADIYNFIISQRSFDSWTHNCNPLYFTAFKYSNLIIELVTIMPIIPLPLIVQSYTKGNDSLNTDTRATQGHNMNPNIMFTHDRSILNDIDPDINYVDSNCWLKSKDYTEKEFNDSFKPNEHFSIFHLNIRSIRYTYTF